MAAQHKIAKLYLNGMREKDIVKTTCLNRSTVQSMIRRFKAAGNVVKSKRKKLRSTTIKLD
jgi:transposase